MKSSLAFVLIALQAVTAGVVVALLVGRNDSTTAIEAKFEEWNAKVQGSVNQMRQIVNSQERLRQEYQGHSPGGGGPPSSTGPGPGTTQGDPPPTAEPAPAGPPAKAFPEATAALAKLKDLERQYRDEVKNSNPQVNSLKAERDKARSALVDRGNEAVFVVGGEIDLQPFQKSRDARFVAYLLDEVVPAFGAVAKSDALKIARGALVRSTNEAPVKFAAARAMQRIDDGAWVRDVIDVVKLGTADEVDLRAQLLGLFAESPRPEAVDLCKQFMEGAQYPMQLRTKSIFVIEKQNSDAVNKALRSVLFDDPSALLKIHALDALWARITDPAERAKLLDDVLAIEPARLPPQLKVKAEALKSGKPPPPEPASEPKAPGNQKKK